MENIDIDEKCKRIVELNSRTRQLLKVSEECCELSRAVSRYVYDDTAIDNLVEEYVDVLIVCRELEHLIIDDVGIEPFCDLMEKWETKKIANLDNVIEDLENLQ